MSLSEKILTNHGLDYSQEISVLIFNEEMLVGKLEKNKLLKKDRESLIEALGIIRLGEYE